MTVQKTRFRGQQNILEKTVWDGQIADDAAIQFHKLENMPLAADGSIPATGDLDLAGFRIIRATEPIDDSDAATKYYVDNLPANGELPADYIVHYIKDTLGAPHGTASDNELCLNIREKILYEYSSGNWGIKQDILPDGTKFIFAISGTDTTGLSGIYSANSFVYKVKNNGSTIYNKLVKSGVLTVIRYPSKDVDANSGWVFDGLFNLWRCLTGSGSGSGSPISILPGQGVRIEVSTIHVNVDNETIFVNSENKLQVSGDFVNNTTQGYLVAGEGILLDQIDSPSPNSALEINVNLVDGGEWVEAHEWVDITSEMVVGTRGTFDGTKFDSEVYLTQSLLYLNTTGTLPVGTILAMRATIIGTPPSLTWSWPNSSLVMGIINNYTSLATWETAWNGLGMRFSSLVDNPFSLTKLEIFI